jgi:predicted NUDIX family phosphoesterase
MEFVFVVPRVELFGDCYPQGLVPFTDPTAKDFDDRVRRSGFFVERDHAEHNPDLKQVIPYSIVVRGGEILVLRRLAQGGEKRLHDKLSIGVGGHINPVDADQPTERGGSTTDPVASGTRRELKEELYIEGDVTITRVGILNDDSNPVGAVHVGLVQVVHAHGDVRVREDDVLEGSFVAPDELRRLLGDGANFESWSQILIHRFNDVVPDLTAVFPEPSGEVATRN